MSPTKYLKCVSQSPLVFPINLLKLKRFFLDEALMCVFLSFLLAEFRKAAEASETSSGETLQPLGTTQVCSLVEFLFCWSYLCGFHISFFHFLCLAYQRGAEKKNGGKSRERFLIRCFYFFCSDGFWCSVTRWPRPDSWNTKLSVFLIFCLSLIQNVLICNLLFFLCSIFFFFKAWRLHSLLPRCACVCVCDCEDTGWSH